MMPGRPTAQLPLVNSARPRARVRAGLDLGPRETGKVPTIKQLRPWIFLTISEEKNGQADGVRQNEKWKQLGRTGKAGRPQGVCLGVLSGWGRGWASPPLDGTPGGRARWGRAHAGFLGQRLGVYPGSPERTPPCEAGEEPTRRQPGSPIPAAQREAGWPARGSPGI